MFSKALKQTLYTITHIKGSQNYQTLAKTHKSYILNFSAAWCGPCKAMAPVMAKKQEEGKGKWHLLKVDIDDESNGELADKFQVQAVPTMIYFKDGKQVHRTIGGLNQQKLNQAIQKIL